MDQNRGTNFPVFAMSSWYSPNPDARSRLFSRSPSPEFTLRWLRSKAGSKLAYMARVTVVACITRDWTDSVSWPLIASLINGLRSAVCWFSGKRVDPNACPFVVAKELPGGAQFVNCVNPAGDDPPAVLRVFVLSENCHDMLTIIGRELIKSVQDQRNR